jgi:hypothetical protein
MTKIAISYRRHDSDAITGRIFDRLVAHYGADSVFRDIDNIPPGIDFRKYIGLALESTDIVLAVVGPQWAGKTPDGRIRIREATDLVRIEIETALRKEIPLVPILVGSATMPEPSELPEDLQDFSFRNAVKVDALEDFEDHVKRLIRSLDRLLETGQGVAAPAVAKRDDEPRESRSGAVNGAAAQRPDNAHGSIEAHATSQSPSPREIPTPTRQPVVTETKPPDAPIRADESAGPGTTPRRAGGVLILPIVAGAVYLVLHATGLWTATQIGGYSPLTHLTLAALFAFALWRYGRVGASDVAKAAVILWAGSSALSLGFGLLYQSVASDVRGGLGLVSSLLLSTLIMAVGSVWCPGLRKAAYWGIALIVWTALAQVAPLALTPLISEGSLTRSALSAAFFAVYAVKQMVVFACLGYWLSSAARADGARG